MVQAHLQKDVSDVNTVSFVDNFGEKKSGKNSALNKRKRFQQHKFMP